MRPLRIKPTVSGLPIGLDAGYRETALSHDRSGAIGLVHRRNQEDFPSHARSAELDRPAAG